MSHYKKVLIFAPSFLLILAISVLIFNSQKGRYVASTVNKTLDFTNETTETNSDFIIDNTPVLIILDDVSTKLDDLSATTSSIINRIEILEKNYENINFVQPAVTAPFQKQIIYIGSADINNLDWVDTGIEVTLNSSDYPSNVNTVFEAGLSSIGGIAYARLLNKTTGSVMAVTEISSNTGTTTWKTSPSFKLFNGTNIYAVQMKSSSGDTINASGARVVIGE